jgi:hypothetical protein
LDGHRIVKVVEVSERKERVVDWQD